MLDVSGSLLLIRAYTKSVIKLTMEKAREVVKTMIGKEGNK